MTARIKENQLKGLFIAILFIVLVLQVLITQAQSFQRNSGNNYRGLVASFGTRSVTVSSNIVEIDQTNLMETGGQVGVIFGNNIFKSKIGLLGYYSSTGNVAGSTDLYETNAAINFYPLSMISDRSFIVEPYLAGGISYDRFKFFGCYINEEPGITNYSVGKAPFLGKMKQVNATVGLGLELKLRDRFDFVHLFSEVKYGHNLSSKTDHNAFAGTSLNNQMQVVVGISFGANR